MSRITSNEIAEHPFFEQLEQRLMLSAAPVLDPIGDKAVDEGSQLSFAVTATDADIPAENLTFSLGAGAPAGASIDLAEASVEAWAYSSLGADDHEVLMVMDFGGGNEYIFGYRWEDDTTVTRPVRDLDDPDYWGYVDYTTNPNYGTEADANTSEAAIISLDSLAGMVVDSFYYSFGPVVTNIQYDGTDEMGENVTGQTWPTMWVCGREAYTDYWTSPPTEYPAVSPDTQAWQGEPLGMSSRVLYDGYWDGWSVRASDWSTAEPNIAPVPEPPMGEFTWTATEAGTYEVTVVVTDDGTPSMSDSETFFITVNAVNEAPVADANGPYFGVVGESLSLDGSASSDPDAPPDSIVSYEWDLNNDGQYDDAEGATPTVPWSTLDDLDLDLGTHTIGLRVSDTFDETAIDTTTLTLAEPPAPVEPGDTATIGFWRNDNGQTLIKSLNGGGDSTLLGDWLAATLPNMYSELADKDNEYVANFYMDMFKEKMKVKKARGVAGPAKVDAQVMATALATYVTNLTLVEVRFDPPDPEDPSLVAAVESYGFTVTEYGLGAAIFDVGDNGQAFGEDNGTEMTVLDILVATDEMTVGGLLYDLNESGSIERSEQDLRAMANAVYSGINEQGDISTGEAEDEPDIDGAGLLSTLPVLL